MAHESVREFDSGNDANYFPGIQLVDPRRSERILSFARAPELSVILVNTGGQLDTLAMNRALEQEVCRSFAREVEDSFGLMVRGLTFSDPTLIGAAATQSALLYQRITPKPGLEEALNVARRFPRFVGLACGHSGTVLGFLSVPGGDSAQLRKALAALYGAGAILGEYEFVSGGFYEQD
jgi:uncharacterized protein involved in propanediol utilization